ncbi:2'-N-acetylparomamine deacetylase [Streptomyces chrestomyceticus JCM 4735]|uniref:2'-N-acetylparomamine deacetylase n=1 Tax=Streptomyces chrestomyceticus JCM 4735 TaxID=1306181 RepID=A0A7U9KQ74_9ACTN|nr:PIG-L family deacetylase [Streptomyces chrestomyceticus]GCD32758.1 2'-N-acetylparomamine deacetylase [Streptomyces chrestomyceticus JCM 4735]
MTGLIEELRDHTTLWISPHPDDVAYSCGGVLAACAGSAPGLLLTVFTRSAWALPKRLRAAGPKVISARRAQEERRYCRARGLARYVPLGFDDASLRGYDDDTELTADPAADPLRDRIAEAVAEAVAELRPTLVLAPAAVGGHVDHRLVHEAVRRSAGDGVRRLYYEDLPYAAHHPRAATEKALGEEGLSLYAVTGIGSVLQDKVRGMYIYGCQTDDECVQEVTGYAREVAGPGDGTHVERVWAPSPAAAGRAG